VCVVCVWKFLGNFDPAFASAEHHHPLLVYLAWSAINHSFIEVKVACPGRAPHRICLCTIGREGEGHVRCVNSLRCVSAGIMWCALPPASIVAARPVFVGKNCK
jgi:hypothetical protein